MLTRLTTRLRFRAAAILAALYAICVIAPPLALAFADEAAASHCLTDDHGGAASVRVAADGLVDGTHFVGSDEIYRNAADTRSQSGHDSKQEDVSKCCGLFCAAEMMNYFEPIGKLASLASAVGSVRVEFLAGRMPDPITRPPIIS